MSLPGQTQMGGPHFTAPVLCQPHSVLYASAHCTFQPPSEGGGCCHPAERSGGYPSLQLPRNGAAPVSACRHCAHCGVETRRPRGTSRKSEVTANPEMAWSSPSPPSIVGEASLPRSRSPRSVFSRHTLPGDEEEWGAARLGPGVIPRMARKGPCSGAVRRKGNIDLTSEAPCGKP